MKLAPLLTQYLNTNKRLALRGIGLFLSTPSAYIDAANSKNSRLPSEDISFQNNPETGEDEDLIKFISAQTGKMRALAISDLESYLELMQQFLNIGKPFELAGIGTLVKIKQGLYEFTPGHLVNEKITESTEKESSSAPSFGSYRQHPKQMQAGFTFKKAFIAFLLFGGMGMAVWGGYALYNKNRTVSATVVDTQEKAIVPVEETTSSPVEQNKPAPDTLKKIITPVKPGYKFVFETTPNKRRAIKRFNFLKNINSDIHLETIDSTLFNITVNLNIPPSDTTRVKDSLNSWYYGKKDMLVKIASPNTTANVP